VFKNRSNEKEILDLGSDYYTPQEFEHCQKMLFLVNKLLGCFHGTVKLLKHCSPNSHILDVGCGAGLFILNLSRHFPSMTFEGVDISAEAINMAEKEKLTFNANTSRISFNLMPEPKLSFGENSVDVILANMVCHHLTNEEIVEFFKQALKISRHQVIINDLHRNPIAYWFYKIFSPIIFRDKLITHDGLISIKRSFVRKDFIKLLKRAEVLHYKIEWCFPFRWRVIIWK
jgi:2-polyprenyl-3-methyl-5-hydroxy-6-metoxy-1,4-benzoquinol methylase